MPLNLLVLGVVVEHEDARAQTGANEERTSSSFS